MTMQTLMERLRAFIAARRILATRRFAFDQIARHPEHLAGDLDLPPVRARPALIVVWLEKIFDSRKMNQFNGRGRNFDSEHSFSRDFGHW